MNIGLVIAALLPAIVLCVYIFKKDRVEKEPIGLLLLLFGLGAVSCFPVAFVEGVVGSVLRAIFTPFGFTDADGALNLSAGIYYVYHFLEYFVGVGLVEEGFKFLILILVTKKNRNFNCLFDGMIYAIFVSLGFAALENVMYVTQNGFGNAVLRAIFAVPGHMFDAVLMGFYYSMWHIKDQVVQYERDLKARNIIREFTPETEVNGSILKCILVPTLAHGFYDFCCTLDSGLAVAAFYVFVIFMYIHCFRKIRRISCVDGYTGDYAKSILLRKYPELFLTETEDEGEKSESMES